MNVVSYSLQTIYNNGYACIVSRISPKIIKELYSISVVYCAILHVYVLVMLHMFVLHL